MKFEKQLFSLTTCTAFIKVIGHRKKSSLAYTSRTENLSEGPPVRSGTCPGPGKPMGAAHTQQNLQKRQQKWSLDLLSYRLHSVTNLRRSSSGRRT